MPLLLEQDATLPLPKMVRVRQHFKEEYLEDIEGTIRDELQKEEIRSLVRPGMRIALAVGSRGIRNLQRIVKCVAEELLSFGAKPFVIGAMGSHGGGTVEGQREILASYGITEEEIGIPVVTSNDVVYLGETSRGIQVYFDKLCYEEVDLIIPINRVKLHTDFVDTIQSGMCKMLVIGLGHHTGCSAIHEIDFQYFGDTLREASRMIMKKAPVGFGIGILENAYDQTCHIEAVLAEHLIEREAELVEIAKSNMPLLMIPDIDILVVGQIGKDISGAGYDPNILGRSYLLHEFVLPVPKIKRMILLDVTEASHGNAIGMGAFDIITKKVFDQLDLPSIYTNGIAVKCIEDCRIPLIASGEEEAIRIAVKVTRDCDPAHLKIVKIQDTLHLDTIEVSEALLDVVEKDERLEIIT